MVMTEGSLTPASLPPSLKLRRAGKDAKMGHLGSMPVRLTTLASENSKLRRAFGGEAGTPRPACGVVVGAGRVYVYSNDPSALPQIALHAPFLRPRKRGNQRLAAFPTRPRRESTHEVRGDKESEELGVTVFQYAWPVLEHV